jgi:hypothetical protein
MNWKTACDNTELALSMMIENSYFTQRELKKHDFSKNMSQKAIYHEACTIRLCSSRRCGHTTAIANLATEYFSHAFFLAPNVHTANRLKDAVSARLQLDSVYTEPREISKVTASKIMGLPTGSLTTPYDISYTFGSFKNLSCLRGCRAEAIFIDCASFMSKNEEENVYAVAGASMCLEDYQFFIFVE